MKVQRETQERRRSRRSNSFVTSSSPTHGSRFTFNDREGYCIPCFSRPPLFSSLRNAGEFCAVADPHVLRSRCVSGMSQSLWDSGPPKRCHHPPFRFLWLQQQANAVEQRAVWLTIGGQSDRRVGDEHMDPTLAAPRYTMIDS